MSDLPPDDDQPDRDRQSRATHLKAAAALEAALAEIRAHIGDVNEEIRRTQLGRQLKDLRTEERRLENALLALASHAHGHGVYGVVREYLGTIPQGHQVTVGDFRTWLVQNDMEILARGPKAAKALGYWAREGLYLRKTVQQGVYVRIPDDGEGDDRDE